MEKRDWSRRAVRVGLPIAILLALCFAAAPQPAPAAGDEYYYAIYIRGKLMGYEHWKVTGMKQEGGQQVATADGETILRLGALGRPLDLEYTSKAEFVSPDWSARSYTVTERKTAGERTVSIRKAGEKWLRKGTESPEEQEVTIPPNGRCSGGSGTMDLTFLLRGTEIPPEGWAEGTEYAVLEGVLAPSRIRRDGEDQLDLAGKTRVCDRYAAQTEQMGMKVDYLVWVERESRAVVRLLAETADMDEVLTDPSITQSIGRTEMILGGVATSNVQFADPGLLDYLKVDIDAELQLARTDEDVVRSGHQTFAGEVKERVVKGTLEVRSVTYDGAGVFPFPLPPDVRGQMEKYLKPEERIESDDPTIKAKAEELTAGATDAWDATKRIADWVYKNIGYDINMATAKECLELKRGDCGPHSFLTIALCRSVGIPARLAAGAVYTGAMGGTFMQHAWTEVYVAPDRWIPIDSTSGQITRFPADHLGFMRVNGIKSLKVNVVEYNPPEAARPAVAGPTGERRPLTLPTGQTWTYSISIKGEVAGKVTGVLSKVEQPQGKEAFRLDESLKLDVPQPAGKVHVTATVTFLVEADGTPVSWLGDYLIGDSKQGVHATFAPQKVKASLIMGDSSIEREVDLPAGVYCIANNMFGEVNVMLNTLPLAVGKQLSVAILAPNALAVAAVTLDVKGEDKITVVGQEYECFVVDVPQSKETWWVSKQGMLLRGTSEAKELELVLESVQ